MELPILLLQDALDQQKKQLEDTERRNKNPNAPSFEFRNKAIANLKHSISEIEEGISLLTKANAQKEVKIDSETKSRCCGRCNGYHDLCVDDMECVEHNITGCEKCFGPRG